jgi:nucleotide-binding universal stress UspA family protein
MKTIVIATDFSENAREASRFVFETVKDPNTSFLLLNAYMTPHTSAGVLVSMENVLKKTSEENLLSELKWVEDRFGKRNIRTASYFGELKHALESLKKEIPEMLLVMGSTGTSKLEEFFLGSTTEAIIRATEIPTIVVPHTFLGVTNKNILVAVENADSLKSETKKELHSIATTLAMGFELVTIQTTQLEMGHVIEGAAERVVKEFFDGVEVKHQYLIADTIEEGLWQATKNQKADILCVVHHNKGMLKDMFRTSISKEMVKDDLLPIIVLHEKE